MSNSIKFSAGQSHCFSNIIFIWVNSSVRRSVLLKALAKNTEGCFYFRSETVYLLYWHPAGEDRCCLKRCLQCIKQDPAQTLAVANVFSTRILAQMYKITHPCSQQLTIPYRWLHLWAFSPYRLLLFCSASILTEISYGNTPIQKENQETFSICIFSLAIPRTNKINENWNKMKNLNEDKGSRNLI